MLKTFLLAATCAATLGLTACGESAEEAGERMDSSVEEATQGEENLGDGALERAGESIDEATGNQQTNDGADALNDATDGDNRTNP